MVLASSSGSGAKADAQQRVDEVLAFRRETARLEADGVLVLADEQRQRVAAYHDALLADLTRQFDVDATASGKQMSLAMQVVSLLAAVTLSAAVFLFFARLWGALSTPVQVALLVAAPLVALAAAAVAARYEKTLYVTSLASLLAFACFVLDLSMLGDIFNIPATPNAWLAFGVFALILAYTYGLRLPLLAGLFCLVVFLLGWLASLRGIAFFNPNRPEDAVLAGLVLVAAGSLAVNRRLYGFGAVYRGGGTLLALFALIPLSEPPYASYLPLAPKLIELLYDIVGFGLAGAAIAYGTRRRWPEMVYIASAFFAIFVGVKFYDWFWDWMPKYVFFLILGGLAVGALVALGRVRGRLSRSNA